MATCSFCGHTINLGRGVMVFRRDGSSLNFDSRKCEHYHQMGRNPVKLKWTGKYATSAKKKKKHETAATPAQVPVKPAAKAHDSKPEAAKQ